MLVVAALAAALMTGCGSPSVASKNEAAPPVSERQALAVLNQLTAAAPGKNGHSFCEKLSYQVESCEKIWKEAAADCLKPAGEPHVRRSAAVRNTRESDGGRVLEVEGKTASGQRYVSEVFVTAADGTPKASVGVYWSGSGLGDSPLGGDNKVIPKPECGDTEGAAS
ncbi:hypothetical protein ACFUNF_42345 [Streptomyces sp. NPDC057291]|uniref:hypothetical protein n=1 Tax=Streptomyces sp. NPDC057291 TaxID=3346087 RepID=UPI003641943D